MGEMCDVMSHPPLHIAPHTHIHSTPHWTHPKKYASRATFLTRPDYAQYNIVNIPEGLLTYTGAQASDQKAAYGIALAIALHNIPEGFAVAMPIYIATRSRGKAMLYGKL